MIGPFSSRYFSTAFQVNAPTRKKKREMKEKRACAR
jgi:hypothetical protein